MKKPSQIICFALENTAESLRHYIKMFTEIGQKICGWMCSYWFEIRVELRAVLWPVFNTLFLFVVFSKANIDRDIFMFPRCFHSTIPHVCKCILFASTAGLVMIVYQYIHPPKCPFCDKYFSIQQGDCHHIFWGYWYTKFDFITFMEPNFTFEAVTEVKDSKTATIQHVHMIGCIKPCRFYCWNCNSFKTHLSNKQDVLKDNIVVRL